MRKTFLLGAALAAATLAPAVARAVPVPISGTGTLGSFSGSFDFTASNDTSGVVDIVLNNDSATAGFITGFLFNIPAGADVSSALFSSSNANFGLLGATTGEVPDASFNNGENGAPNGQFDIGASTGSSYEGQGAPNLGIPIGASPLNQATFQFTLTGTGFTGLTAASFLSTLSVPPGDGDGLEGFVVRFRGFADGGSDKVPNGGGGGTPVPEPGTAMLIGLGLASLAARRRARQS